MIKSAPVLAAFLLGTFPARSAPLPSRTEAPSASAAKVTSVTSALPRERLLHETGDPDSTFSVPGARIGKTARLGLAVGIHDVVLKALTPAPRASEVEPRPAGDFHALDTTGRPYQLSVGARLTF
ncbi:MAG TPA: hypothetical protein VGR00_04145 [Thermoanaerobaculia bacterium]|nr:hypothetical protein [Thermoanaerobaculia bacterium]